ncbi:flagella synthesis protein FlgN [Vibrio ostreicida]|uniref:Flagellar export chaperone FlgN n=1 Tax=Vibrio ostreicida TaxID=526588 RepID=A0ABT8BT07_9VIBR|nr:flagellar export chaperone FlgN [Vibrio ostreicida]MDN3609350.1 flagellar export chaperone FlgN [Vibrio ostreicida]NPD08242.1 flagellar protein FlgN [Vibrio ostreicida]
MAALSSLVEFQLKNATDLSLLLEQEKVAIARRVAKEIEQFAKEKLTLVNQLQQTDQRISQHPDVATLESDPELSPLVDQIRSIVHDCQQANIVNGEALQRAQMSFNKLNNIMQQTQGKLGMTYTADGQTKNVTTLGTNIKA